MTRIKLALGIAVSGGLLAYLIWSVDRRELLLQLRNVDWGWALLGMLLGPLGLWARARRWRYLFPPGARPPGLLPAVMIGYMANNVLPLRAGEFVRVYVVARRWGRGFWTVLATLVVERVLDSLAIVLVLGVLVLLIPVPAIFQWTAATLLGIDVVAVAVLGGVAAMPDRFATLLAALVRRWPALERRATRVFETFLTGLQGVRTARHTPPLLGWTVLVWVLPALAAWTMLRAVNLDLPLVAGWTVMAFVGLGVSIPSAPGYVGVFHYAAVLGVAVFGVERAAGLGFAILFHASQIIPVTLAGWLFLLREQMTLGEVTRARRAEDLPGAVPAGDRR